MAVVRYNDRFVTEVFVTGYPKSGNTWLSRLLGEVLNSPVRGDGDKQPLASEGHDRPGDFIVRQQHAVNEDSKNNVIVGIYRDPRDVCVSCMYYWGIEDLQTTIYKMANGEGPLPFGKGYPNYMRTHYEEIYDWYVTWTSYEKLKADTAGEIVRIANTITKLKVTDDFINGCIQRQSFDRKVKHISENPKDYSYGPNIQKKLMRKGIVGDWKNHFNRESANFFNDSMWCWIDKLGYESDVDWWRQIES